MPRKPHIPKYGLHKATGQGRTTINGKAYYFGPYEDDASYNKYKKLVAEHLAGGVADGELPTTDGLPDILVSELMVRYLEYAECYYVKNGEPTGAYTNITYALRPLRALYADTLARDFGPKALKLVREHMIAFEDLSRKLINDRVNTIRRMFKWATSEELVPAAVYEALRSVDGLRRGRTRARETEPVQPVPDDVVEMTLPFMSPIVADMVRVQRLTGMRPGSVVLMRPCDLDRSDDIWVFTPSSHKTEHHGIELKVLVGPQAQAILTPYMTSRSPHAFIFSPTEAVAWHREQRAAKPSKRKTKLYPSERKRVECEKRQRRRRKPKQSPGDRYTEPSYYRAIVYALDRAKKAEVNIPHWFPNQLRHAHGTAVRKQFGIEEASILLGHRSLRTTAIYAERDLSLGKKVARRTG